MARLVASRVLFGSTPYGNSAVGTPETLGKISQGDLAGWYRSQFQPANAVLIVTGDATPEEASALATKYLGAWKRSATKPVSGTRTSPAETTRRIIVVDRPDAGQSAVYVNRIGIQQSEQNLVVPELTNDILGGGYSARLNREVRVKRGLSYGANSALDPRLSAGPLILATQTKNETAGEAARVLVDELVRLGTEPPTAEEFAARQSALSGDFARALETGGGLAGLVGQLALYNRPLSELQTYLSQIQAVTPEQVQEFAKERFSAANANVVIVGNAAKFLPDLKTRFPGETVTVIPFARLDLNRADLLKGGK
ncbi:MAG: insulinase family protein [Fibrella sp.]|nr:insulinase family protein [Armatimonadota bacterium]